MERAMAMLYCLIVGLLASHLAEAEVKLEDEPPSDSELQARTRFLSILKNNYEENDLGLEGDALSFITSALGKGSSWEVEMVIGAELIPTLVESLSRQKGKLRDRTLNVLRIMSEKGSSVDQFRESEVMPSLEKVAHSTLRRDRLLNVGQIAFNYFKNAYLGKSPTTPPTNDVREIVSILRILAETGDKKLLETVSRFVEVISKVEGVDVELRTSGILSLISGEDDPNSKVVEPQKPKDKQCDAPNNNNPHPEETETEEPLDGSQVLTAIKRIVAKKDMKTLKAKTLQRVISSMMERLDDRAEQLFEEKLLEMDELAPFVLLCLEPENDFGVHLAGIRVINLVIVEGMDAQREALIMLEVLSALTALLPRGNEEVCSQALSTIKLLCETDGIKAEAVDQLRKTDVLTSLIKLTKDTKEQASLLDVAGILSAFSVGNRGLPPDAEEGASPETKKKMEEEKLTAWKKLLPPADSANDIFTLSKLLMKATNDEITKLVLMSLVTLNQVEGEVYRKIILEKGLLPAVLPHISYPDKELRGLSATLIMATAAGGRWETSRLRYYEVFKNLEGTQGMKDFYKFVQSLDSEKEGDKGFALAVKVFLQRLEQALSKVTPTEIGIMESKLTDAVLKSGFAYSIVKLMEGESPKQFRKLAGTILYGLTMGVKEYQATYVLQAEVVPKLVRLLNCYDSDSESGEGFNCVMAGTSLGMLARIHPEARDEIISAGAVPKLFNLIQNPNSELETATVLLALCMIMGRKPLAPVELFEELPESLRQVITKHNLGKIGQRDSERMQDQLLVVQRVCQCIRDFAEYGPDQVEQLEDEGLFKDLVSFLRITEPNTQKAALQAVKRICTKKPKSQDSFVKLGIVKMLPEILQSSSPFKDSKKIAAWLMMEDFKDHFTPKQKAAAKAEFEK